MKKDFHTAFLDHIYGKTVTSIGRYSTHIKTHPEAPPVLITGYATICGEYAMIAGGAGCGGHDVCHAFIVKLKSSADSSIEELIACETEYL